MQTNIMQRGAGNLNNMKLAKCILELEKIHGIKNGGNRKSDGDNLNLKTQEDLANQIGIDQRQLQNYKKLNDLIPELQSLVETGALKATTAYKIWEKYPTG